MENEHIFESLKDTAKKIADLKEFHVPVVLKIIEDYEQAGIDEFFIEQQKLQLQKIYSMIAELEAKAERLLERLK